MEYTNFQKPYVGEGKAGAALRTVDVVNDGNEGVGFNLVLLNQSGNPFLPIHYKDTIKLVLYSQL